MNLNEDFMIKLSVFWISRIRRQKHSSGIVRGLQRQLRCSYQVPHGTGRPPHQALRKKQSFRVADFKVPVGSGNRVKRCSTEGPVSEHLHSPAENAMERRVT
jgi:hypothetical protein